MNKPLNSDRYQKQSLKSLQEMETKKIHYAIQARLENKTVQDQKGLKITRCFDMFGNRMKDQDYRITRYSFNSTGAVVDD